MLSPCCISDCRPVASVCLFQCFYYPHPCVCFCLSSSLVVCQQFFYNVCLSTYLSSCQSLFASPSVSFSLVNLLLLSLFVSLHFSPGYISYILSSILSPCLPLLLWVSVYRPLSLSGVPSTSVSSLNLIRRLVGELRPF